MRSAQGMLVNAWYRGAWWLCLLRPLEGLFRTFAAARRALYRCGLLARYRAPRPVVVVGNITVGGVGKTPVVIALARALHSRGIRVGVVSRGYGGRGGRQPYTVKERSDPTLCGDEPLLIHRRTGCPCVVAPDRSAAVRALLADNEVDLILSDDGLQHYRLARDLEIAVLDARRATGNGYCLPAGPLREPESRLQSVDFVLYRGGHDPATGVTYEAQCLVNLASSEQREFSTDALGRQVYAVAGLGQPRQFFDQLRESGFDLLPHPFADHYSFRPEDFAALSDRPIIMTEKDAVKCAGIAGDNAWYLKINARLPEAVIAAVAALARPVEP